MTLNFCVDKKNKNKKCELVADEVPDYITLKIRVPFAVDSEFYGVALEEFGTALPRQIKGDIGRVGWRRMGWG